jgi:hypothetical protein
LERIWKRLGKQIKPMGEDWKKIGKRLGKRFKLPATKLRFINQIQG